MDNIFTWRWSVFYEFPKDYKSKEVVPGWMVHFVVGEHMSISRHNIKPKTVAPMHTHVNEQMGMMLDGEFEMTIGDKTQLLKKGDMYRVPPNVVHGGATKDKVALIVESFSPPRDYLKL